MNIGPAEIAVLAVVVAVLFGGGIAVGVIVAVSSVRRRNQLSSGATDPMLTEDPSTPSDSGPFPTVPDRNNSSKRFVPTSGQVILPPVTLDTTGIPDDVRTEIGGMLADGQLIGAIKLVRDHLGLGLKEAKDFAERWRDQGAVADTGGSTPTSAVFAPPPFASGQDNGSGVVAPPTGPVILPPDNLDTTQIHDIARLEIGQLLAQGKAIQAIKKIREVTGLGLKDAKDVAERWRDHGTTTILD